MHVVGHCDLALYLMATRNPSSIRALCQALARMLTSKQYMLSTAESCTGGLIAAACTGLAGSSFWFERGFITYSNAAKSELLGVEPALIDHHGAVSEAVARAMAEGAVKNAKAQVAVAVTGVAGPGGGSTDKPVGTVWIAWATPLGTQATKFQFAGSRSTVRKATVQHALLGLLERLSEPTN